MNDQRETKRKAKEYALEKIGGIIILFNIIIGFLFIALITLSNSMSLFMFINTLYYIFYIITILY